MKYGISALYFQKDLKCDFQTAIQRAADLGFDVLEIDSSQLLSVPEEERICIKHLAEREDIELCHSFSLGKETDISSDDPQIRKEGYDYILRILELVHEMGGTQVGGINYTGHHCFEGRLEPDRRREHCANVLKKIMPVAKAFKIEYNAEVTNGYENFVINTAAQARAFCEKVGSEKMGILLDVNHMIMEEDSFYEAILTAGDRLHHFHVAQNNRKVPVDRGFIPWDEISQALDKIGYNRTITLEPLVLTGGELGKGAKIWRNKCESTEIEQLCRDILKGLAFIKSIFG